MDGPKPESRKRCSWCGALNPADAPACSKCGAALSALQPPVSASPSPKVSPTLDEENRAPYQDVVTPLVDSSLFDRMSGEAMRSLGQGPPFVSGRIRAIFVVGCLSLYILLSVVGLVADYYWIQTLSKIGSGLRMPLEEVTEIVAKMLLIRLAQLVVILLTAVFFLAWIYRAHQNLKALGATDLKYSPGWAIGGFFVPFLNIVRPYEVVTEIWRASGYEAGCSGGPGRRHAETPIFIALWWGSWLTWGISRSLGALTVFGDLGADVYHVFNSVSAALAITVVLKINARQENAHRLIWSKSLQDED